MNIQQASLIIELIHLTGRLVVLQNSYGWFNRKFKDEQINLIEQYIRETETKLLNCGDI